MSLDYMIFEPIKNIIRLTGINKKLKTNPIPEKFLSTNWY
ncbi:hypothetical protein A33Q_1551 [Indibacter alkaliphilus LW1]|uniref:Uncharacterized protein n=1 Tax=Indibacter alkaliphilus (strain CCUG 57479 / KCTC 22604 / LW1) TaxID=1189612 RepID=S2DGK1_INDAL|nr:hypothetical protein A33Q_1551 [Indibacter alkaliphilus LW1]